MSEAGFDLQRNMFDVIIIGAGPAGCAAAVYSARKNLNTLLITQVFGGQAIISDKIENWLGEISLAGWELAKKFENHVRAQEGIAIKSPELVSKVQKSDSGFLVITDQGQYESRAVIVTSGGQHRRLQVPGEKEFEGKGVAYCSTCDAPFYKGKTVAVIGAGNSGLEAVVDLLPYANKVYLLNRREDIKGDPTTLEQISKESDRVVFYNQTIVTAVQGDQTVKAISTKNLATGQEDSLSVDGVFVEIGMIPNGDLVKDLVDTNERNEIKIDHKTAATSCSGIFAAGDVTDAVYKQSNIAAGDGVKAALSAYSYLIN